MSLVLHQPGPTELDVIPSAENSSERDLSRPIIDGAMVFITTCGMSCTDSFAAVLPTWTKCPQRRSRISGRSARASQTTCIVRLRSEEQTTELQSLMRNSSDVFCMKKKIKNIKHTINHRK